MRISFVSETPINGIRGADATVAGTAVTEAEYDPTPAVVTAATCTSYPTPLYNDEIFTLVTEIGDGAADHVDEPEAR